MFWPHRIFASSAGSRLPPDTTAHTLLKAVPIRKRRRYRNRAGSFRDHFVFVGQQSDRTDDFAQRYGQGVIDQASAIRLVDTAAVPCSLKSSRAASTMRVCLSRVPIGCLDRIAQELIQTSMTVETFPVERLREEFPALRRAGSGVFFDNAAGAQVPQAVFDAVNEHMLERMVQRGGRYSQSIAVDTLLAQARASVGALVNARDPNEIASRRPRPRSSPGQLEPRPDPGRAQRVHRHRPRPRSKRCSPGSRRVPWRQLSWWRLRDTVISIWRSWRNWFRRRRACSPAPWRQCARHPIDVRGAADLGGIAAGGGSFSTASISGRMAPWTCGLSTATTWSAPDTRFSGLTWGFCGVVTSCSSVFRPSARISFRMRPPAR